MFNVFKICYIAYILSYFMCVLADPCIKDEQVNNTCGKHVFSGLQPEQKKELLNAHNAIRSSNNLSGLPNLEWDNELQESAQKWADQCKDTIDECKSTNKYRTVEQVVSVTHNNFPFNLTAIVNEWAKQKNNPAWPTTKQQLSINRIGCGIKKSKVRRNGGIASAIVFYIQTYYVVCNYATNL